MYSVRTAYEITGSVPLYDRLERIAFNAGSLEHSFLMSVEDYLRAAQPARVFSFTSE